MAPVEDTPQDDSESAAHPLPGAVHGSGDIELEAAITRVRGSLLRLVTELDRFCDTVRESRERIEQLRAAWDEEHSDVK